LVLSQQSVVEGVAGGFMATVVVIVVVELLKVIRSMTAGLRRE
jgi:hypothetical protein